MTLELNFMNLEETILKKIMADEIVTEETLNLTALNNGRNIVKIKPWFMMNYYNFSDNRILHRQMYPDRITRF